MKKITKISVIIPCFNEVKTIKEIVDRVSKFNLLEKEIIIIDDGSYDGSREIIKNEIENKVDKVIYHDQNKGKGSAIKNALSFVTGNIVIIQDADLEYNPEDYKNLIEPFIKNNADVVYGSRFIGGGGPIRILLFWHSIANKFLTFICNIFTNLNMTDMETGYKVFKTECIKLINLQEKSFGFEPEITIKLAKRKFRFFEVPISYSGRTHAEGKKITYKDAIISLYCIIKYSLLK